MDCSPEIVPAFLACVSAACNRHCGNGEQEPVLVHNVESMQLPQVMTIPILVGLDTIENFIERFPTAWYFAARQAPKLFGSIENWERRVTTVCGGINSANERTCQMIQRASQVVESVSQLKPQMVRDVGYIPHVINDLSRLIVNLCFKGVRVISPEYIDSDLKLVDMLFSPIVFC